MLETKGNSTIFGGCWIKVVSEFTLGQPKCHFFVGTFAKSADLYVHKNGTHFFNGVACTSKFYMSMQDHFRRKYNNILEVHATPFQMCVQHYLKSACNTILKVCATPFQKCVQHHFRNACNTILGVRATSFRNACKFCTLLCFVFCIIFHLS